MEPPATLEDEFNDWYDTEHIPERRAIAGFDSALRFVCVDGWPRYLAFYDLRSLAVLESKEYLTISGENFSPWSKRILKRVRGLHRAAGEQVYHPANVPLSSASRLLMIRFRNAGPAAERDVIERTRLTFEGKAGVHQVRVLRSLHGATVNFMALVETSLPAFTVRSHFSSFGPLTAWIDLVNEYVPYELQDRGD
jgi:hypothetical protein